MIDWPLGRNAKLNEVIALVAVASAVEAGTGYNLEIIKRHADRAARLWAMQLKALEEEKNDLAND